jgi:hypothetical protein
VSESESDEAEARYAAGSFVRSFFGVVGSVAWGGGGGGGGGGGEMDGGKGRRRMEMAYLDFFGGGTGRYFGVSMPMAEERRRGGQEGRMADVRKKTH